MLSFNKSVKCTLDNSKKNKKKNIYPVLLRFQLLFRHISYTTVHHYWLLPRHPRAPDLRKSFASRDLIKTLIQKVKQKISDHLPDLKK